MVSRGAADPDAYPLRPKLSGEPAYLSYHLMLDTAAKYAAAHQKGIEYQFGIGSMPGQQRDQAIIAETVIDENGANNAGSAIPEGTQLALRPLPAVNVELIGSLGQLRKAREISVSGNRDTNTQVEIRNERRIVHGRARLGAQQVLAIEVETFRIFLRDAADIEQPEMIEVQWGFAVSWATFD